MMWGYGMEHGWGWFGMGLSWLIPILLVLVAVKYLASKSPPRGDLPTATEKTAADYLDESYAKGEISREEFMQKRDDIKRR